MNLDAPAEEMPANLARLGGNELSITMLGCAPPLVLWVRFLIYRPSDAEGPWTTAAESIRFDT